MKRPNQFRLFLSAIGLTALVGACGEGPTAETTSASASRCDANQDIIGQFIRLPKGSFVKGDQPFYPEEQPTLRLQVDAFAIQAHEVTNAQFAAFIDATQYVTDAERSVLEDWEGAGSSLFASPPEDRAAPAHWQLVEGATWRTPNGPGSSLDGRDNYPVIHVSQRDAAAYAQWAGGRLPSEVEWEYAASLGLPDPTLSTSGARGPGAPRANTWQGVFPVADTGEDGFGGIAPVGCFPPDRQGLHDMIGNVWEWTDTPYAAGQHTLKGGSYLCADNFCRRYRPAAKQPQDSDFSSNHIGFRIVRTLPKSGES